MEKVVKDVIKGLQKYKLQGTLSEDYSNSQVNTLYLIDYCNFLYKFLVYYARTTGPNKIPKNKQLHSVPLYVISTSKSHNGHETIVAFGAR